MNKSVIIILICFFIIFGCGVSLYIPASKDEAEQQVLLSGRELYVEHCSSCHDLYFPKQFSKEQWKIKLERMAVKAKINKQEQQNIYIYLISQP